MSFRNISESDNSSEERESNPEVKGPRSPVAIARGLEGLGYIALFLCAVRGPTQATDRLLKVESGGPPQRVFYSLLVAREKEPGLWKGLDRSLGGELLPGDRIELLLSLPKGARARLRDHSSHNEVGIEIELDETRNPSLALIGLEEFGASRSFWVAPARGKKLISKEKGSGELELHVCSAGVALGNRGSWSDPVVPHRSEQWRTGRLPDGRRVELPWYQAPLIGCSSLKLPLRVSASRGPEA